MSKRPTREPWAQHDGSPAIPLVITQPMRLVQVKEDQVRGRCRSLPAQEVDWDRVTHWRWACSNEPSGPDQMTLQQCDEQRRQIGADITRLGADLLVAKRRQDDDAIRELGQRIQALNQRAGDLKLRRHSLTMEAVKEANVNAYKRAAQEILPPDLLRKLYDRANAIQAEMSR